MEQKHLHQSTDQIKLCGEHVYPHVRHVIDHHEKLYCYWMIGFQITLNDIVIMPWRLYFVE